MYATALSFLVRAALLLCCWMIATVASAQPPEAQQDEPVRPSKQTKITISKETTYVLGPLDEQGYVDYLGAINEHTSRGVTPENNAAVLLWQALGPAAIDAESREEYFRQLGIEPLPEEGNYYTRVNETEQASTSDSRTDTAILLQQMEDAGRRPWSQQEFPAIYNWLERNEAPLALVVEATKRPQYYSPLVPSIEDGVPVQPAMISALLPLAVESRDLVRALTARAMLRVHAGDVDAAWQDLLACYRLGRLVGRGATLIDLLVGIAIEGAASTTAGALAHYTKLSTEQAAQMIADLNKLPPLQTVKEKIDHAERYMMLDTTSYMVRAGIQNIDNLREKVGGGELASAASALTYAAINRIVDWDEVLRRTNARFDQLVQAFDVASLSERRELVARFEIKLKQLSDDQAAFGAALLLQPSSAVTDKIDSMLTSLLMPAVMQVMLAQERPRAAAEQIKAAFALSAYRTEHGRYPAALADLVPKHLDEVPLDPFTSTPMLYQAAENTVLIYSVGNNLRDDRGDDSRRENGGDDIVLRLPPKLE